MRFQKRPVVIEARLFDVSFADEVAAWCGGTVMTNRDNPEFKVLAITTLEGVMHASPGDWIIQGVKGAFYPCKPDIFEQTYQAFVGEEPEPSCACKFQRGYAAALRDAVQAVRSAVNCHADYCVESNVEAIEALGGAR